MLRDAVSSCAAPWVRKTDAVHFGTKLFQKGLNDWVASQVNNSSMLEVRESTVFVLLCFEAKLWRRTCFPFVRSRRQLETAIGEEILMVDLEHIKITRRDQQVLKLLVQGCSNKEIAAQLEISPRTVKQHLRTLFLRAGIRQGRKRVILATAIFEKEQMNHVASRTVESYGN
jgi:DNA-binding CsgD family transcriptional regulator